MNQIQKTAYEHRMYWEPWLESAESYNDLRESLKKRGIKNIPLPFTPMHVNSPKNYVQQYMPKKIEPETKNFIPIKGMVQKNKSK